MHPDAFKQLRDTHYITIAEINDKKGADYAGDADALANFKEASASIGITPFQVWFVYFHKHYSAVARFVEKGQVESEPIGGRIHDCILYLFLLLGLIEDDQTEQHTTEFEAVQESPNYLCECGHTHRRHRTLITDPMRAGCRDCECSDYRPVTG